jgi:hypothetical protein
MDLTTARAELARCVARYSAVPPAQQKRLDKALALVAAGAVWPCPEVPGDVLVFSERSGETYRVGPSRCECPDAERRGAVCKHRLARRLFFVVEAALAREAKAAALSPVAGDAASYVRSGAHAAAVVEHEADHYDARELDTSTAQPFPDDDPALAAWDEDLSEQAGGAL